MSNLLGVLWRGTWFVPIAWGFAFAGNSLAMHAGMSPATVVLLRVLIAAVGFTLLAASRAIDFRLLPPHSWPRLAICTLLAVFVYHGTLVSAQQHVSATVATIIVATSACWLVLFDRLWNGTRMGWSGWLGSVLALGANACMLAARGHGDEGTSSVLSILFAMLAPIALAASSLVAKPLLVHGSANVSAQIFMLAGIVAIPLSCSGGIDIASLHHVPPHGWLAVIGLGLGSTVLAYWAWFRAVDQLGLRRASIVQNFTPICGMLWSLILLAEPLTVAMLIGLGGVLAGSWLVSHRVQSPSLSSKP